MTKGEKREPTQQQGSQEQSRNEIIEKGDRSFIKGLLSGPIEPGAKVVTWGDKGSKLYAYEDDTFLLKPDDEGYVEGRSIGESLYPISENEAEVLIAHGVKDLREETGSIPSDKF